MLNLRTSDATPSPDASLCTCSRELPATAAAAAAVGVAAGGAAEKKNVPRHFYTFVRVSYHA